MNNTIKLTEKRQTQMIAHRGVSGLETENTNAAFVAAGNRSYFGIETDVHKTVDGNFVVFHDDSTGRVAVDDLVVEASTYDTLRSLLLKQIDGKKGRSDIRIPNLEEYIGICRHYEKTAVLEIKNHMEQEDVDQICDRIEAMDYLDQVIFISFDFENLVEVRKNHPNQKVQFLTESFEDGLVERLKSHRFDLDIYFEALDREKVDECHEAGIAVNCWTVNEPEDAKRLIGYGVDYITSNILE